MARLDGKGLCVGAELLSHALLGRVGQGVVLGGKDVRAGDAVGPGLVLSWSREQGGRRCGLPLSVCNKSPGLSYKIRVLS